MNRSAPTELFESVRLLAFTDGVFGVAITLLVIDMHLPASAMDGGDAALLQALALMGPKLVVFAFTFIVLGMSWLGHHRKFSYIDKVDGRLLWMNLFYLMAICLVPFASSMVAEHGNSRFAFALYAGVMALTDMVSAGLSAYGLRKPFLGPQLQLRPTLRRDMVLSPLLVGAIFVMGASIALGGWLRLAHWTLFMILPVMALLGSGAPTLAGLKKS
jgi:uncharacterized membrane protein